MIIILVKTHNVASVLNVFIQPKQLRYPQGDGTVGKQKLSAQGAVKLDCETGFGASVAVTATFWFCCRSTSN